MEEALPGAELVVVATPSHATRDVMRKALPFLPDQAPMVTVSKGIENDTLLTMTQLLEDCLPESHRANIAILSGPSFAKEMAAGMPTVVTIASRIEAVALKVQSALQTETFRTYTSTDVIGVEIGGALKNVIAVAAGITDGLGFGLNARSALITRGLAEITRIAVRMGANPLTLMGLSGLGDLVLTCTGDLSRNRRVGIELGQGPGAERHPGGDEPGGGGSEDRQERPRPLPQGRGGTPHLRSGLRHHVRGEESPSGGGGADDPGTEEGRLIRGPARWQARSGRVYRPLEGHPNEALDSDRGRRVCRLREQRWQSGRWEHATQ